MLIKRCPSLRCLEIHMDRLWEAKLTDLVTAIQKPLMNLEGLYYDVPGMTDEVLGDFLERIAWRCLSMFPSGIIGDISRRALLKTAPAIE